MEKELDKCKEMINIQMQRDGDYDEMTIGKRESFVGPEQLCLLHKALIKIGISKT